MKESETIELKKTTSTLKKAVISISAILNKHNQGTLYFGIKNDGTVVGQQSSSKTLRYISNTIADNIEPRIYPQIQKVQIDSKECIEVTFKGKDTPYYAYGRVYIRVSDEDRRLSPKKIENLILKKNKYKKYWDYNASNTSIENIDKKELRDFLNKANQAGRLESDYDNYKASLDKLGLINNNKLLNAGKLLFCPNNPLEVQLAVFSGKDKTNFIDIKNLQGNLFHIMRRSEIYIKSNIRWSVHFRKREREESPEIPLKAIREALVNSFCHRDYKIPKSNEIAIFKNRIEIYNPGRFPDGLEPEDYIKGHERSVLRNPLLANMLYLSRDIEKWGSGLKRIYKECTSNNIDVEFKTLQTGFLSIFYRKHTQSVTLGERLDEKLGEKLGENETKILELLSKNNTLPITKLAQKIGISTTAIENNIKKLKKKNILERKGPPRGGHWEIKL